jgi:hypothetical protein
VDTTIDAYVENTTMSIMKQLKHTGWFYFDTLVDAIMERVFDVYSYPEPSPVPHRASASLAKKNCESPLRDPGRDRIMSEQWEGSRRSSHRWLANHP